MKNNQHIYWVILLAFTTGPVWAGGFSEDFEDINQLPGNGWVFDNRSDLMGDATWNQGFESFFPAHAGPNDSCILGGVVQTGGHVLCDWLVCWF